MYNRSFFFFFDTLPYRNLQVAIDLSKQPAVATSEWWGAFADLELTDMTG